jgi:hypothetical protein
VHKANLGSQLSIFDTGSSARARPRPNDPPERVQPGALKRPARTTETKRQGRAGQTSCTSVHKANLGSQLSIFDTGSPARARPRPNDPPERVQPGALKRPARTTETKRQGRAGQTSCTSVHKANLGSQLSIFDTGSSARARPRPNDPPERVQPGALKRPARTTETKRQGRAGQTSCTSVHKANLGSQLSIFDTGSSARARPRPNDPPERVQPGALKRPARTTETKRQGRAGQTSCTSVHKANLGSQLSIFDTGSSARARPRPNDPPERVQPGALKRPARTTERSDKGEPGKRAARACTKPTSGHNLAFLIRARPPGRALDRTTRPNEFNRAPSNDPPERPKRSDKGEPGKRAARACTKPTSGHNLAFLIRARPPGRALARTTRPNEFNRAPSNDPPERPKRSDKGEPGKRAARACTKPTSGHNLAFLIRARPPGRALARTTRPNEFNRAPSNDPPERVQPGALKRPARTTETKRQGRAGQTSCTSVHKANLGSQLSIFDTGSSARARPRPNDPPERVQPGALKRPARTTETKRQGRAGQTSCTSVHKANLGSQLSIFDTGSSARARPRPNDPPERVQPGALKRPARTTETKRQGRAGQTSCTSVHKSNLGSQLSIFDTGSSARARPRPNEFNRAPSNDPPERPKRSDKGEPGKRAARACTKPTSGHNLAFLIRARPPGRALARTTRPNEFNRAPSNDPPERPKRSDKGEPGKRAARAHKSNLGSQLSIFDTGSSARARPRPNEFNRAPSNDPPERPKRSDKGEPGKRAARACTKPTSGHNLAFLIRARPPGRALARTTRPNEFNRAPSNDPPERPKRSDKGEPGKRAARACTKPTSGHNLAILIRARPPGRALARTSSTGRPQTTRPNDRNEATRESRANELHERAQSQPRVTT